MASELPSSMTGIAIRAHGAVSHLSDITLPLPTLLEHDILVEIKAVSVNPVDTKKRKAGKPDGTPVDGGHLVLGYDAAGIVRAVGPAVTLFKVGDEVFYAGAMQRPGTNAQFHAVDERIVGRKPSTLNWASAAALPLVTLTAWEGILEGFSLVPGHAYPGKSILILAGAGGVGSIAIQLVKALLPGMTVIATASRPESVEYCRSMGADLVIDHSKPLLAQLQAARHRGCNYVMSCVDVDKHWDGIVELLLPLGKICAITFTDASKIDTTKLFAKRGTLVWELMFTRPLGGVPAEDLQEQHRILNRTADMVDAGQLRSTMTSSVPFTVENLRRAHQQQEAGTTMGKQVLVM